MTLDQQIQVWNVIGTWVAGLATFGAVIMSLYLARQPGKVKLKATAGLRDLVGNGFPAQEVLQFAVTNHGERPVTVSNVGWVVGKGKARRYAVQLFGSQASADIPQTLAHGQREDFLVFFSESPEWLKDFAKNFVKSDAPAVLASLRAEIYTSVDQTVTVKPEAPFLARLAEAFKEP